MSWERLLAGGLVVAGLAVLVSGSGVLAAVLLIFGAAGMVDVFQKERRRKAL